MSGFLGPYLDNYALLEQAGAGGEMAGLVERYPWFTLARYMQLRALRIIDPNGYRRALRLADVRLFAHPYPRILLSDELGQEAVPAFLPAGSAEDHPVGMPSDAVAEVDPGSATVAAIDNFLGRDADAAWGRITPPPRMGEQGYDQGYDQEDISVESVSENAEAISETLAGIYVAQGRYDKACAIYYQLSLKYPEKSVYFADLIAHLQLCTSSSSY